jgi:ATP-binding protein involved in chromosome partitioning
MASNLQTRIDAALDRVVNARLGQSVLAAEMVRDVATTAEGRVRLTLLLAAEDDAVLARDVRQAVEGVDGVAGVQVDVKPATVTAALKQGHGPRAAAPVAPGGPPARAPGQGRALPTIGQEAPPRPSAPTPVAYPQLGRIIAVSSGKGGVGKSTVAVNLAVSLARSGARVGIMDADIYGPNLPRMLGTDGPLPVDQRTQKILPREAHGVKVVSLGFLITRDQPAIWRGPIVMKVITQFLQDVDWGQLDYLVVDMPPGTGDAQLSLVQATQVHGALIVTTPQDVATGDALRGAKMFERTNVPVLGIVENMSWFECPHCGKPTALFGSGGGQRLADELGIPLLAQIPLYPRVMEGGDRGTPIVVADADSAASRALGTLASRVTELSGALAAR